MYKYFIRNTWTIILLVFIFEKVSGQKVLGFLNHDFSNQSELLLIHHNYDGNDVSSSSRPLILLNREISVQLDSLHHLNRNLLFKKKQDKYLIRKLRKENLVEINQPDFFFSINPIVNFEVGKNLNLNRKTWVNTRGFFAEGKIGKKIGFMMNFFENQAVFDEYIDFYVNSKRVVPGQGFIKPYKEKGFDFARSNGIILFQPSQHFNVQAGHGKNFIGNGYRSLLLSDCAFNYPYLKITTQVWKLQYVNLYGQMMNIQARQSSGETFPKKYFSSHYLSYQGKKFEISFFESIIWQSGDSSFYRGFDLNYLNPVIFYRPVEFSLGSPDNALIGINFRIQAGRKTYFYNQFVIDDFEIKNLKNGKGNILNKYGYQFGIKSFELFNIKGLLLQTEYNEVRPYTYSHRTIEQNYSHYNEPLAHPLGANFRELISIAKYQYKDWGLKIKINYAIMGEDSADSDWGKNIFLPDTLSPRGYPYGNNVFPGSGYGNYTTQGVRTFLRSMNVQVSFLLNPQSNCLILAGVNFRNYSNMLNRNKQAYIYLGFSMNIENYYYDF